MFRKTRRGLTLYGVLAESGKCDFRSAVDGGNFFHVLIGGDLYSSAVLSSSSPSPATLGNASW